MINICCCSAEVIYKGSTPTLYFTTNAPLVDIETAIITFQQCGQIILEKTKDDITIIENEGLKLKLTQEETLLFSAKYEIEAQLRIKYSTEDVAVTSGITCFTMGEVLKHEVI